MQRPLWRYSISTLREGHVARLLNGEIEIKLPSKTKAEVGERFTVIDDAGRVVAQVKVIKIEPNVIMAREFRSFVSQDVLRRALGAGIGAAVGTFVLEPVAGAMMGAALGSALSQKQRPPITAGMRVIPSLELEQARQIGSIVEE
jgi:hypothetical protein